MSNFLLCKNDQVVNFASSLDEALSTSIIHPDITEIKQDGKVIVSSSTLDAWRRSATPPNKREAGETLLSVIKSLSDHVTTVYGKDTIASDTTALMYKIIKELHEKS